MGDKNPRHGEIVTVRYPPRPAYTERRKWCAVCEVWCWENAIGIFKHRRRSWECRMKKA